VNVICWIDQKRPIAIGVIRVDYDCHCGKETFCELPLQLVLSISREETHRFQVVATWWMMFFGLEVVVKAGFRDVPKQPTEDWCCGVLVEETGDY
jgi:hypothetical protein